MSEEKPTLLNWLGFRTPLDTTKARWLGPAITTFGILVIIAIAGSTLKQFLAAVWGLDEFTSDADQHTAIRNSGLAAVAVFGLPFLIWRTLVGQQQANIAKQSHITDQINKAVENLGATREIKRQRLRDNGKRAYERNPRTRKDDFSRPIYETITEPNLEVRIGGILALERIGKQNPSEHIQIMEILCAYIRENARQQVASDVRLDAEGIPTSNKLVFPRDDIASALTVIARRPKSLRAVEQKPHETDGKPFRLNFFGADFRGIKLRNRDFESANLERSLLQGADFSDSKLQRASLKAAKMQRASFAHAKMQRVNLDFVVAQQTSFFNADLRGATVLMAKMQGAVLSSARMQGAGLTHVEFSDSTTFDRAKLDAAAVRAMELPDGELLPEQIQNCFGDVTVRLPHGWETPEHWSQAMLLWKPEPSKSEFHQAWHAWQDKIGFDRETFELKHPSK